MTKIAILVKSNMTKLMTHMIVGFPTIEESEKIVQILSEEGSDFIELQIPFSDPLADGPIIMNASNIALQNKITTDDVFAFAKKMADQVTAKFILVLYANCIYSYGLEAFCKKAKTSKVVGIIVPDMPFDSVEGVEINKQCQTHGIYFVPVVSANTPSDRLLLMKKLPTEFVYATSYAGVTGRQVQSKILSSYMNKVRRSTGHEVALGFGIKSAEDVKLVKKFVDIVVIGSAIVSRIEKDKEAFEPTLREFMRSIRRELTKG